MNIYGRESREKMGEVILKYLTQKTQRHKGIYKN
jgi:hypothetical protein